MTGSDARDRLLRALDPEAVNDLLGMPNKMLSFYLFLWVSLCFAWVSWVFFTSMMQTKAAADRTSCALSYGFAQSLLSASNGRLEYGCLAQGIAFLGYVIADGAVRLMPETLRGYHLTARRRYEPCKALENLAERMFSGAHIIAAFVLSWLQSCTDIKLNRQFRTLS